MAPIRAFLILLLVLILSAIAFAQDDDPIRVSSSIVRLNVGVADSKGRPIIDLDRSKFEIFEDGVKQQILRFESVEKPFSVVIMLDMSGSTLGFREVIKQS